MFDPNIAGKKIIDTLEKSAGQTGVTCLEVIKKKDGQFVSAFRHVVNPSLPHVFFENFGEKKASFETTDNGGDLINIELEGSGKNGLCCISKPFFFKKLISGYVILQYVSKNEASVLLAETTLNFILVIQELLEEAEGDSTVKYKDQLINMRDIQAKLYPKFENIEGLDVASVFLPVDLMSGDFIDAFFIDDHIYQIVTCDVHGFDASSSFAAAAIRTMVRANSAKNRVPSALIEFIVTRLNKMIAGILSLVYITVYQINIKTGKIQLSSFGDVTTLYFSAAKKKSLFLNKTESARDLARRVAFKDISFMLEPNDYILFYSKGVENVATEDGRQIFGESRIHETLLNMKEDKSLDIVHDMVEAIYNFSNYSKLDDDIVLVCVKRKKPI